MKSSLLLLAILATTTLAKASNLQCVNRGRDNTPSQSDITLKAQIVSATELHSIVVVATGSDGGTSNDVGTAKQAVSKASPDYNPRKFTESNQFILNLKGDKKNPFGTAVEECQFILMIPKNFLSYLPNNHFTIPMLSHCDQSGGREDLSCLITN